MEITLQLFGSYRPYGEHLTLSLPSGAVVADIRLALLQVIQSEPALIQSSRFATETEVLADDAPLQDGITLAIIPPVSGG